MVYQGQISHCDLMSTFIKAYSHERYLLRLTKRLSPFEGYEKVDELQMVQVMIFHNNTIK